MPCDKASGFKTGAQTIGDKRFNGCLRITGAKITTNQSHAFRLNRNQNRNPENIAVHNIFQIDTFDRSDPDTIEFNRRPARQATHRRIEIKDIFLTVSLGQQLGLFQTWMQAEDRIGRRHIIIRAVVGRIEIDPAGQNRTHRLCTNRQTAGIEIKRNTT